MNFVIKITNPKRFTIYVARRKLFYDMIEYVIMEYSLFVLGAVDYQPYHYTPTIQTLEPLTSILSTLGYSKLSRLEGVLILGCEVLFLHNVI